MGMHESMHADKNSGKKHRILRSGARVRCTDQVHRGDSRFVSECSALFYVDSRATDFLSLSCAMTVPLDCSRMGSQQSKSASAKQTLQCSSAEAAGKELLQIARDDADLLPGNTRLSFRLLAMIFDTLGVVESARSAALVGACSSALG